MTKFKGFHKIAEMKYEQKVIQCEKDCGNQCEIIEITTPDGKIYHGDTCERYSGIGQKKTNLPDYFAEREKILMSYQKSQPGMKIGLARVGVFHDMAPFFFTLFSQLGLDVVLSKKTNKKIINQGVETATAEAFCFPIKVAFGHYQDLENKLTKGEVDYIFVPNVIETYRSSFNNRNNTIKETGHARSHTCPYLQNFHALMTSSSQSKKILPAFISFREGNLEKALIECFQDLVNRKDLRNALISAKDAYFDFKEKIRKRGEDTLKALGDEKAVVLIGRPYTSYDSAINLDIVKKILNLGFKVLPQDFLPLPKEDLSKKWPNEMSVQGQLILNAANVIALDKRLEAVFLDYFSCGPNSFIREFFREELGKPFLTVQIDEHTADAGLVTRVEAFLDSIRW